MLGVTGNIATGKSTVTGMLRDLGATVIDSDLVYRELVEPGQPLLRTLANRFGDASSPVTAPSIEPRSARSSFLILPPLPILTGSPTQP